MKGKGYWLMNDEMWDEILETGKRLGVASEAFEGMIAHLVEEQPPFTEVRRELVTQALEELATARRAYGASLRAGAFPAPFIGQG